MKTTVISKQDKADLFRDFRLEDSGLQEKFSNKVNELLAVLDKDIQHIQDIISWLNELRSLVIERNNPALSRLLESIRAEAANYAATELERRSIREDLANALGSKPEQITLSLLETILSKEKKAQVTERKTKLRSLIRELRSEHLRTVLLLTDCARFTRQLLEALFDLGKRGTVYYRPNGVSKMQIDTALVNARL
jgi:flagellar biosynthesis/type III secretory pathway chaperone